MVVCVCGYVTDRDVGQDNRYVLLSRAGVAVEVALPALSRFSDFGLWRCERMKLRGDSSGRRHESLSAREGDEGEEEEAEEEVVVVVCALRVEFRLVTTHSFAAEVEAADNVRAHGPAV